MILPQYELRLETGWYADRSEKDRSVKLCLMGMDLMRCSGRIYISREPHLNNNSNTNAEDY